MKALITGSNGFVGTYLKKELRANGYMVIGADLQKKDELDLAVDVLDYRQVYELIYNHKPDIIFHLAGQASVAKSWKLPQGTMELNVNGTLNFLEAVRNIGYPVRIVLIGSSDQYGRVKKEQCPIRESTEQKPMTPYAVSKCAQEYMGRIYADAYHLDICMTRSFNHVGVGQMLGFVIPDLAYGIVQIEAGLKDRLTVGNIDAYRDFSDVRDIVRGYRFIAERGKSGSVYNIGSGKLYQIRELLELLLNNAKQKIKVEMDPSRLRAADTPVLQCDYSLLYNDTGWSPEISIENTLCQMLEYYRSMLEII